MHVYQCISLNALLIWCYFHYSVLSNAKQELMINKILSNISYKKLQIIFQFLFHEVDLE